MSKPTIAMIPESAVEEWGLQYGHEVYVMDESTARQHPSSDMQLVSKVGGEWRAAE